MCAGLETSYYPRGSGVQNAILEGFVPHFAVLGVWSNDVLSKRGYSKRPTRGWRHTFNHHASLGLYGVNTYLRIEAWEIFPGITVPLCPLFPTATFDYTLHWGLNQLSPETYCYCLCLPKLMLR